MITHDVVIVVVFLDDLQPKNTFGDHSYGNINTLGGGGVEP